MNIINLCYSIILAKQRRKKLDLSNLVKITIITHKIQTVSIIKMIAYKDKEIIYF